MRIRADKLGKNRDRIAEALSMLPDDVLREIERRSQEVAGNDGFGSGGDHVHTQDVSRPTESVALSLVEGKTASDPQMVAFVIISQELLAMRTSAIRVERAVTLVKHITDGRRGREVTLGTCNACGRSDVANTGSDRIKSGYCPACYTEWRRQAQPDRLAFELSRRETHDVATNR